MLSLNDWYSSVSIRSMYLTLPREMLAGALSSSGPASKPQPPAERLTAHPTALERAARILAEAKRPLIITASLGQDHRAVESLGSLAEAFGIPVVCHVPKSLCLSTDHPMHMGYAPAEILNDADVVVVLECDVPWFPNAVSPPEGAKIIHIGVDPLFGRYGIRSFPCDLALAGDPALILPALERLIGAQGSLSAAAIEKRRAKPRNTGQPAGRGSMFHERVKDDDPIHPATLTREIDRIKGPDTIRINELGVQIDHLTLTKPGTYFQQSSADGVSVQRWVSSSWHRIAS